MAKYISKADFISLDRDVRSLDFRIEMMLWRMYKKTKYVVRPSTSKTTVFVTGAQRSGTNMLMECLDWSGMTDAYHESDPRAFKDYQLISRDIVRQLVAKSNSPFVVFKSLCEAEQTGDLLRDFSPSKAIWVVRDFRDTVNSAVRNFPDFTQRIKEIVSNPGAITSWFARGISAETYEKLRWLNVPDMNSASASALRWYIRNVLYFEQVLHSNNDSMLVKYEKMVSKPNETIKQVYNFIGIVDYSSFVVRKVHARSINKNAEPHIHPKIYKECKALQDKFDHLATNMTT